MDYVKALKEEAATGHAVFHEYVLLLGKVEVNSLFLFFEGEDDPAFYVPYIIGTGRGGEYYEFICMGRDAVLKAAELAARDGRGQRRARFFIDRDHTEQVGGAQPALDSIYQTDFYSFENYVVCNAVLRRYWVERLRLRVTDPRYEEWVKRFERAHREFCKKSRILMACVLIGRGYLGDEVVKLNLNNADLGDVFVVDAVSARVDWKQGGLSVFLKSINMEGVDCSPYRLRSVARKVLIGEPKAFIRGKYEVWFFVKFLQLMTTILANKAASKAIGLARAKPSDSLSVGNYLSVIGSLTPCPLSLKDFIEDLRQ